MIRKAIASEEAMVRLCAEQAYFSYVAAIGRKPAPMVADFAFLIASGHIYVALDDTDAVVGFAAFYPQGNHMFLESVAVMPAATRRGIGKSLIRFCEEEARRSGLEAVHLYTNAKMTDNLSIYRHLGYAEVGRRSDDGFDRVFFEKVLA